MIDVTNEQLAADARLAAKCLADTGSFETGQAIINDCADRILAQAATIEALKEAHAEQERYLHEAEALRARVAKADELAEAASERYLPVSRVGKALAAYRATGGAE